MEAKVHEELLSFLAQHSLEETVSNIDDIVLSYLVGVVELVSQGDDGLDIVELMEMMNAYLPGFDQIKSAEVIDWMFGLASKLMDCDQINQEINTEVQQSQVIERNDLLLEDKQNQQMTEKRFPCYDFLDKPVNDHAKIGAPNTECLIQKENRLTDTIPAKDKVQDYGENSGPVVFISSSSIKQTQLSFPPLSLAESQKQASSKRRGKQLSCSSQDSMDDGSETDNVACKETQVRILMEMFPSACAMEARHCLQLSAGNMDRAAQLIMDRQDTGQSLTAQAKTVKKSHKVKKIADYKLEDEIIKSCVLEKYSFIDTEEDKKTYRPPPPKLEAKKLVRYRDGQVVSMKGERFSEVTKKEDEEIKATYVSLKPARKYRFH